MSRRRKVLDLCDRLMKRHLTHWYLLCFLAGLSLFAMSIAWRSHWFFLIYPVGGAVLLIFMLHGASMRWLSFAHVVFGAVPIYIGFQLGFGWDREARDLIFAVNVHGYRLTVSKLMHAAPPKDRIDINPDLIPGYGVYSGRMQTINGKLVITIDTCSGPTLETVAFTREPMPSLGELRRKDELGYWYYHER